MPKMLTLGMPNPRARYWDKPQHFSIKKFMPVFSRTMETYDDGAQWLSKKKIQVPRYQRWEWNFYQVDSTSLTRQMWAIARARRARAGQLKLL